MPDKVPIEELAEAMFRIVEQYAGRRKFTPGELTKEMISQYGEDKVTKQDCKAAIRTLIDSGRCVYSYFGSTCIELPRKEGAEG